MMMRFVFTLIGCSVFLFLAAQNKHPQGYFRNPLNIPMQLSANFGELRPNHWHMGLDIRTEARENLPVYAAAEGYIAHVGIRGSSFGRFIIINHPNGLSTLYAHLNDFNPELEKYVREQQYKNESWAIELDFAPNQFPVDKGSFIAYSGNTGGSQGPHLHFEIMDTKTTKRYNPLLFGFPIQDNTPPILMRLAMYDRSKSVFEQTPKLFTLKNTDSGYIIPKIPILKTGLSKVSFALQMIDKMSGGGSDNGVYAAKLYVDEEPQVGFVLDSIDYDETHYINAHIDYKHDYNGGVYLQHISQLPGHNGVEYKQLKNSGVVELTDTAIRTISIDVKDANNNTTQLNFSIQHDDSLATETFYSAGLKFVPQQVNIIEKGGFEMYLPETCMYDSIPVLYNPIASSNYNTVSDAHRVSNAYYPVHGTFTVKLKPNKSISTAAAQKLIITQTGGKRNNFKKATLKNGWITADFGSFGDFQAYTDFSPPSINSLGQGDTINLSKASRIVFTPTDNFGIKSFRVEIYSCPSDTTGYLCDSIPQKHKWLRFTNDKLRSWIYNFDDHCPYGVHHLKATAEDLVGNITVKEWWFKRLPYTPPPPKKKLEKKAVEKKKKEIEKTKKESKKKPVVKKPVSTKKK
jgi:Peptidase family M23